MKKIFDWLKNNKLKVIIPICIITLLAVAFWYGGETPNQSELVTSSESQLPESVTSINSTKEDSFSNESFGAIIEASKNQETSINSSSSEKSTTTFKTSSANKDKYATDTIPSSGKPKPVEPQNQKPTKNTYYCTISISCAAILDNMPNCDPEKKDLVPKDGWILKSQKVSFSEGESVFDLLKRVCKENKIHLEYSFNPLYNSAYIEGINNLYEFDVGSLSGWTYKVNDWFPNYGCSRYQLKSGDKVEFLYTCDIGYDVGKEN